MKKTLLLLVCVALKTSASSQWTNQATGFTASHESIYCSDAENCLIGGWDGTVLKTVDGNNWTDAGNGIEKVSNVISTVYCIDKMHCFASSAQHLYKTDDGAASWTEISTPENGLYGFQFLNSQEGYALAGGKLLKTIDGGTNWNIHPSNLPFAQNVKAQLIAFTENTALAVVHDIPSKQRYIYRSLDDGTNWLLQYQDTLISPSRALQFASDSVIYLCGATNGYLLKSTDAGLSWAMLANPFTDLGEGFLSLDFISATSGYLVGPQGVFLKTIDGGENWITETYPTSTPFVSVSIADSQTAYAVANGNVLAKTTNAQLLSTQELEFGKAVQVFPNPVKDLLTVKVAQVDQGIQFILSDLQGRIVLQTTLKEKENQLPTAEFPAGTYLYQIQVNRLSVSGGKIMLN